ncbi:hypothetical protein GH714_024727 [Hevea brasiliensis]|uniref:Uncharacterized protein n=1 Tax=Hevea brasiliensis TaxID=3981 RepID=A0A6A6LCD7_HEVBR|nr:hypothetical protein GH714_024727 [Hevea brasiliensis]
MAISSPSACLLNTSVDTLKEQGTPFGEMRQRFLVLKINQENYTMKIVLWDLRQDACPADTENLEDVVLKHPFYGYTSTLTNLTLIYECPRDQPRNNAPSPGTTPGHESNQRNL